MKYLLSGLLIVGLAIGCKKDNTGLDSTALHDNTDISTPTASFIVTAKDAAGNVITVSEGLPVSVRTVTIRYTGSAADYKVVYTGDASHVYIADPANPPAGVTGSQAAVVLSDTLSYTYPAAGSYPIKVISTNVGDKGRTINKSIAAKTITLQ